MPAKQSKVKGIGLAGVSDEWRHGGCSAQMQGRELHDLEAPQKVSKPHGGSCHDQQCLIAILVYDTSKDSNESIVRLVYII